MATNVVCNNLTANGNSTIGANGTNALLINANVVFANGVTYNTANITHNGNLITNQPIYANNGVVLTGNLTGNFNIPVLSAGGGILTVGTLAYPTGNTTTYSPNSGVEVYWNRDGASGETTFLTKSQGAPTGGFKFDSVTVNAPPTNLFFSNKFLFDVKTPAKISNADVSTTTANGALVVSGGVGITGNLNISGIGNIPTLNSTTGTITTLNSTTVNGGRLNATNGNNSTNTTTGALVVSGGVGISQNVYVGGALNVAGGIEGAVVGSLLGNVSGNITSTNANITNANITNANIVSLSNLSGVVNITNTTPTINAFTGALIVSGGVGCSTNIHAGGTITSNTQLKCSAGSNATSTTTGCMVLSGGVGIDKDIHIGGNIIPYQHINLSGTDKSVYFLNSGISSTSSNVITRLFQLGDNAYYDFNDVLRFRRHTGGNNSIATNRLVITSVGTEISGEIISVSGTIKTPSTLYLHANNSAPYTAFLDSTAFGLNTGVSLYSVGSSLNLGSSGTVNAVSIFPGSTQLNSQYLFINAGNNNNFLLGRPTSSKPTTNIGGTGWSQPINAGLEIFWNSVEVGRGQTDFLSYGQGGGGGLTFSVVSTGTAPINLFNLRTDYAIHNTNVSINKQTNAHALDVSGTTQSTALIIQNKNAVSNYNNIVSNNFNLTIPFASLHFVNTNPNGADLTVNLPTITTAQDGAQFFIKAYGNYQVVVNSPTANINYNNTFLTSRTIPVHQSWLFVCVSSSYYVLSTT